MHGGHLARDNPPRHVAAQHLGRRSFCTVEWVNSFIHRFLRQIGPGMQLGRAGLLELVVHLTVIRRKEGSSHSPHGIISHFLCSFLLCRTTARCVVAGCNIIDSMRPGNAARALDILQPAPSVARRMLRRGTSAGFWAFCDRSFSSAHAVRAVAALRSNGGAAPPNGLPPAWNAPAALCVSSLQAENDVTPVSESSRQHVSAGRMSTAAAHGRRAEARAHEASLSWAC